MSRAAEEGTVVPVFAFDPAVLAHGSPSRVAVMLDALASLRDRLGAIRSFDAVSRANYRPLAAERE